MTLDPLQNDRSPGGVPLDLVSVVDGGNEACPMNQDLTVTCTPGDGFTGIDICLFTVCNEDNLCNEGVSAFGGVSFRVVLFFVDGVLFVCKIEIASPLHLSHARKKYYAGNSRVYGGHE